MSMRGTVRILRPLVFGVILAAAPFLYADEAMDRLVRLVGRDAGLCVEIPHLDETLSSFEQGDFFHRLERSKIYAEWKTGNQYRSVAGLAAVVEKLTGKPARQFVREIFGTAVVVAAYAEPGPKLSAVLMSETMSKDALESAINVWNRAENPQIETIEFAGHTYYKRFCAAKAGRPAVTLCYATLDRTLVLSDREELVRRALTLSAAGTQGASLLDLPAYRQAREAVAPHCAARAYVNPRAFDAMLGVDAAPPKAGSAGAARFTAQASGQATGAVGAPNNPNNSAVCRTIQAAWRRTEWLAIGVQTDRGIVAEAVAHYSTDGLSQGAQHLLASMSGPPELLGLAPPGAFAVLACRQPFGRFLQKVITSQMKQGTSGDWESFRRVSRGLLLGLDPLDDILPSFRENFGGYLAPHRGAKPEELPFDALLAAQLPRADAPSGVENGRVAQAARLPLLRQVSETAQPGAAPSDVTSPRAKPSVRDAIDNGLNMGLNFAAAYFNMSATGTPAVVRTEAAQGRARVRWIDGLGPYQPAYGLTADYLVVATSPQAVRDFAAGEAAGKALPVVRKAGEQPRAHRVPSAIAELAKRYFPTENQVLFVDAAALRRFLTAHGAQLVQHAIRIHSITPDHAQKTLTRFFDVAGLFDSVFVAGRLGNGSFRVVLGGVVEGASVPEAAAAR